MFTESQTREIIDAIHTGIGNNVSEMDIPADSQVIGIPLDIDKKYTLGIHADVEENTEIHVIIQDGNETL